MPIPVLISNYELEKKITALEERIKSLEEWVGYLEGQNKTLEAEVNNLKITLQHPPAQ